MTGNQSLYYLFFVHILFLFKTDVNIRLQFFVQICISFYLKACYIVPISANKLLHISITTMD